MSSPTSLPPARPLPAPLRAALMVLSWLCVGIGLVGVFVPGLPTTVFIVVAAWAAARSSPRFHAWLLSHPVFGRLLRNWSAGRCVSHSSKWSATVLMSLCAIVLFVTQGPGWIACAATLAMACVLVWLWRRPVPREEEEGTEQ